MGSFISLVSQRRSLSTGRSPSQCGYQSRLEPLGNLAGGWPCADPV